MPLRHLTLHSLGGRLLLASALLLPLFLGATGYILDLAFQRSLEASTRQRLQSQVYLLLSAAEMAGEQLALPDTLGDPQFNQIHSGLYALIIDEQQRQAWRSPSAQLLPSKLPLDQLSAPSNGATDFKSVTLNLTAGATTQPFFLFAQNSLWETESGREQSFNFYLLQDKQPFQTALAGYRAQLWQWLGALSATLLIVQMAILRWGLQPLAGLARDLQKIESGESQALDKNYPQEIRQVTANLNRVLAREQQQRQRYRNSLADLAHSLKTPLAALRGALVSTRQEQTLEPLIDEQITHMDQIISHQLQRAMIHNPDSQQPAIELAPLVTRLCSALEKVYLDKSLNINSQIPPGSCLKIDERDLMELLGNLLENACKYCRRHVELQALQQSGTLQIIIGDDGPGIACELQQKILRRGARADSNQPGQGIGLAVAVDIINNYGGDIQIDDSVLGGAEFTISLPR